MKRCGACGAEFENQFNFCPTDGKSLVANRDTATTEIYTLSLHDALPISRETQIELLIAGPTTHR